MKSLLAVSLALILCVGGITWAGDAFSVHTEDGIVYTVGQETVDPFGKTSLVEIANKLSASLQLNEADGIVTAELAAKEDVLIPINSDLLYNRGPENILFVFSTENGTKDILVKPVAWEHDIPPRYFRRVGAIHMEKGMSIRRKEYFWEFRPGLWDALRENYGKLPKMDPRKLTITLYFVPYIYVFEQDKTSIVNTFLKLRSGKKNDMDAKSVLSLSFSGNTLLKLMRLEKEWEKKGRPRWTDTLPEVRVEPSTSDFPQAAKYLFSEFDAPPPRKAQLTAEQQLEALIHRGSPDHTDVAMENEKRDDNETDAD